MDKQHSGNTTITDEHVIQSNLAKMLEDRDEPGYMPNVVWNEMDLGRFFTSQYFSREEIIRFPIVGANFTCDIHEGNNIFFGASEKENTFSGSVEKLAKRNNKNALCCFAVAISMSEDNHVYRIVQLNYKEGDLSEIALNRLKSTANLYNQEFRFPEDIPLTIVPYVWFTPEQQQKNTGFVSYQGKRILKRKPKVNPNFQVY